MKSIICRNLGKKYKDKVVLENVNLEIEKGKIYGLIGRNGAGKTTLISVIAAQNPASQGEVLLGDEQIWENPRALSHICFSRELTGSTSFAGMKVKQYLKAASLFYQNWDQNMAEELVKEFELDVNSTILKLSKGMMSMVTIIVALASKADFTFLDEPVAGLDVVARDMFYKILIEEYAETGRTFVVSTHIIDEASDIFEEVIIVNHKKIVLKENTQQLIERSVHVSGRTDVVDDGVKGLEVFHAENMGRSKGVMVLLEKGQHLKQSSELSVQPMTLQNIFVSLCGNEK